MSESTVVREVLSDQQLPAALPTTHVEIRRITMSAGISPGAHTHNGPVFGSIERGGVVFQIDDGPELELGPGDTFYEPADTVITRFDATDDGVVFLAYFLLTQGQASELRSIEH